MTEQDLLAVMNVLVAANRLGFQILAQQCERRLAVHLEYVRNEINSYLSCNLLKCAWHVFCREFETSTLQECLQFAQSYNLSRLEKQCSSALRRKEQMNFK